MSAFKDYVQSDMNAFFSDDEFATVHTIDGRQLSVVVDNDKLAERTQREYDGIYVGDLLFYVSASDYRPRPKPESVIKFDGRPYTVFDAREDFGVYEIILKGSES